MRLTTAGRARHDALRDLLHDAATATTPGDPPPTHLTVIATLAAVEGRLGALPAQLTLSNGRTTALRPETLQRLGCNSQLDAVLLDALGTPVGASQHPQDAEPRRTTSPARTLGTDLRRRRLPPHRTVPHHVIPWWLSHLTRLLDLVPLCASCHHDLHEGHRTLRLKDQRLIDDHGWVQALSAAA